MDKSNKKKLEKLRLLQDRFATALPQRLTEIKKAWETAKGRSEKKELVEVQRLVHSLAGSAGTFLHVRLGEAARELELQLEGFVDGSGTKNNDELEQRLTRLFELARKGPDGSISESEIGDSVTADRIDEFLVDIIEDDEILASETSRQLQNFGYETEVFHSADDYRLAPGGRRPGAIVADIHLPEGSTAGTDVVGEFRGTTNTEIPAIFISAHNTWPDRLNAVRAGGQAFMPKPLNYDQLVEQLDSISGRSGEAEYRVLIVDDSRLLAEHYAAVLESANMVPEIVTDPSTLLEIIPGFTPDLILMDLYMVECNGIDAAAVVRQHTGYTNVPIVFLSTEGELNKQMEAMRVGGDDFLQKPIADTHLIDAVRIRSKRFRDLSALMNRDSLTGLLNHINLKLQLEREIEQAKRRQRDLSFAMLDIDRFKMVNDKYGHPVGDRVIKGLARLLSHRLRKSDIAARYGGEEFALILPDTKQKVAVEVVDELRRSFAEIIFSHGAGDFSATLSAGLAAFPQHDNIETLISAADAALYCAKQEGRNRVSIDASRGE